MTGIPPFPFPFDYCSIERASRLFNCENEDLVHLIHRGKISAFRYSKNSSGPLSCIITSKTHKVPKELEDALFHGDALVNNGLTQIIDSQDFSTHQFLYPVPNDCFTFVGTIEISGLVPVKLDEPYRFCTLDGNDFQIRISHHSEKHLSVLAKNGPFESVYLNRFDLEKIHNAIYSGEPIAEQETWHKPTKEDNHNEEQRITKTEEKHNKLIAFACLTYFNFKNNEDVDISSASALAGEVLNQSYKVDEWKDKKEDPMSQDRLTRLLSPIFKQLKKL